MLFLPVQEANIGIQVINNWWLDAGLFTTHIGTESFLPKNNYLSSTAMATYNEPFYQAGARLSYEGFEKLSFEVWALNGYNLFVDTNDSKSLGFLLSYSFGDHSSITYTNLFGNESTDPAVTERVVYHNIYFDSEIINKLHIQVGADVGTLLRTSSSQETEYSMHNYLATVRYQFTKKYSITGRYENFQDENGIISGLFTPFDPLSGLQATGITIGAEAKPNENSYLRMEYRTINSDYDMYVTDGVLVSNRTEFLITMGHFFTKNIGAKKK